jgi:hypothetical protein
VDDTALPALLRHAAHVANSTPLSPNPWSALSTENDMEDEPSCFSSCGSLDSLTHAFQEQLDHEQLEE